MKGVSHGNADKVQACNGWFVGFFVDNDPYRQTRDVEIKWKKNQPRIIENCLWSQYGKAFTVSVSYVDFLGF